MIYSMLKDGDTFMFTFSGHGGQTEDLNGDESDSKDECIYDAEFNKIIDDELYKLLVEPFPKNATLIVLLDCCHSGTGVDLPWVYNPFEGERAEQGKVCSKKIYCISGCRDPQTSADAWIDRKPQGALTANLCKLYSKVVSENLKMRWSDFLTLLRYKIEISGYDQIPVLSCSMVSLIDSPFFI